MTKRQERTYTNMATMETMETIVCTFYNPILLKEVEICMKVNSICLA